MYKVPKYHKSAMTSVETTEGETLERKVERIIHNGEPIEDGAPEIFTERKDGVLAGYNIKTDRWEIAAEAMDAVTASLNAKRDARIGHDDKVAKEASGEASGGKDGVAESTQGKSQGDTT